MADVKVNGFTVGSEMPLDQASLLAAGFQYAIDAVAKDLTSVGRAPSSDAIIFTFATMLGERLAMIPERHKRRLVAATVEKLIRQTMAVKGMNKNG